MYEQIYEQIENAVQQEDVNKACELYQQMIDSMLDTEDEGLGQAYIDYGVFLEALGEYMTALDLFVLAYEREYQQEELLDHILQGYYEPNSRYLKDTYEHAVQNGSISEYDNIPGFEEINILLIPRNEEEYYLFDRLEKCFCGIVNVVDLKLEQGKEKCRDLCSDITLVFPWDIRSKMKYVHIKRLTYCIVSDWSKALVWLAVPELADVMDRMMFFFSDEAYRKYFHENKAVYLPRNICGVEPAEGKRVLKVLEEEHAYRLTPEGRDKSRLLLNIAIPTWDRGHRALEAVKSLLYTGFDAEIEISVSNNGSTYYLDEYEEIANMEDARVQYFAYEENQGPVPNWRHAIEMSEAPFSVLLSDEDKICIQNLPYYLGYLKDHPELGIMRTATLVQAPMREKGYFKKGMESLWRFWVAFNYISGMLYSRKAYLDNEFWSMGIANEAYYSYPQLWWDAFIAWHHDGAYDDTVLVMEGDCELEEQYQKYAEAGKDVEDEIDLESGFLSYARYEARMKQHEEFTILLNKLPLQEEMQKVVLYNRLCGKTAHLLWIVRKDYEKMGYDLKEIIRIYKEKCLECFEWLQVNDNYRQAVKKAIDEAAEGILGEPDERG